LTGILNNQTEMQMSAPYMECWKYRTEKWQTSKHLV